MSPRSWKLRVPRVASGSGVTYALEERRNSSKELKIPEQFWRAEIGRLVAFHSSSALILAAFNLSNRSLLQEYLRYNKACYRCRPNKLYYFV